MKVLMIARETLFSTPGGDTIQIISTAKYLRKLEIAVDVVLTSDKIKYEEYDLMHFFNIIRPDDILVHILKSNLPFVVSTIYVDYSVYERLNRKGLLGLATKVFSGDKLEYLKAIARHIKNGIKINSRYYILNGHKQSVKFVAKNARILLPNSDSEYGRFEKDYRTESRYLKVSNAIDTSIFTSTVRPNENFRNHILCVGRIEGRKNQLNLINALSDTNFNLTIIGKASPNHISYFNECKRLAAQTSNIQIIEHVDHDELGAIYQAAKVHVLPSWFETTGLSSLEAGVMNCNLVITKNGDTEEYFKDYAFYCEPDDLLSIRNSVIEAYNTPVRAELRQFILDNYTWQHTASQTLAAYKEAIAN